MPFEGLGYQLPGLTGTLETFENSFTWGDAQWLSNYIRPIFLDPTAADAGVATGENTRRLRAGLVMGRITATKLYKPYLAASSDGSEVPKGILLQSVNIQLDGVNTKRWGGLLLVGGGIKATGLILAGASAGTSTVGNLIGHANATAVRNALKVYGIFDDDYS